MDVELDAIRGAPSGYGMASLLFNPAKRGRA